jgi:5-methylcytosine-specific restriction endonuclease McrA
VKPKTLNQLKKKADAVVSISVRKNGDGRCYTCGLVPEDKMRLQCGHFISRTHSATRYDPDNLRPQCFACNVWKRGNIAFFAANLLKEIGRERFDDLIKRGRTTHQLTTKELEEIIKKYE